MIVRYRRTLSNGLLVPLAATLVGCAIGDDLTEDEVRLNEAVEAAQAALMMELPDLVGDVEPVGIQNGIPVVQFHAPEDAAEPYVGSYGYGGWLGERGFAVYSAPTSGVGVDTYLLADDGDTSDGAPGEADGFSMTWNGAMVGMDTMRDGDAGVLGDAQLDLRSGMGGALVDVEFSNVAGINNDMEYQGQRWVDIPLDGSNFDADFTDGSTLDGQFYGGNHQNVMGEFAYDSLVGAWGAVRMPMGGGSDEDDMMDDDMMDDDMMDDDMMDDDMMDDDDEEEEM